MEVYILVALGIVAVAFLVRKRGPSPYSLAKQAAERNSIEPIVHAARDLPPKSRSAYYQKAIGMLWENWQRPLAVQLIREFCSQHSEEKICQFWLRRVMEVEPATAKEVFDDRFLEENYRPEVAQACGLTSS